MTQAEAAEAVGISVEFYARIERGTTLPSTPTLHRLSRALCVPSDALLGLDVLAPVLPTAPPADGESPALKRLFRRLRRASARTVRIVQLLVVELEERR